MEHELGEIVTLDDGRRAIIITSPPGRDICCNCIFYNLSSCEHIHCANYEREDETDIIYKELFSFVDD